MSELIITNGDMAVERLRSAGFDQDIILWRDVLHDGPVPELPGADSKKLEALSALRASFLAEAFDQPQQDVVAAFEKRDRTLRSHHAYDEVTLWFEHDLYDQLQLLQILDFFQRQSRSTPVQLVQADDYLGQQSPEDIGHLAALKTPVSAEQTSLAATLFEAFRKPAPTDLMAFLEKDLSPLPHMLPAINRLFEELPDAAAGLSRTQRQALLLIRRDDLTPKRLFRAVQMAEEAIFMGDWSFWRSLDELAFNTSPLIQGLPSRFRSSMTDEARRCYLDASLTLTDAGRAVLEGKTDHARINEIDRWLGGTHITGAAVWRWDRDAGRLRPPA